MSTWRWRNPNNPDNPPDYVSARLLADRLGMADDYEWPEFTPEEQATYEQLTESRQRTARRDGAEWVPSLDDEDGQ